MDGNRFDDIIRSVATSRRPVLRGLAVASLPSLLGRWTRLDDAAAKGKRKNKKKKPKGDPRCRLRTGIDCPGCCDQKLRCRDGLARDACGIGIEFCQECLGDEECTSVNGEMQCCVPADGECDPVNFTCCPDLQCTNGRCCVPHGDACEGLFDCCDGECINGTCCAKEDRACIDDDDCCGDRPCLRMPTSPTFICCPENRQCSGRCCSDSENRIFNNAGDCGCCEPPKELCEGSLIVGCCNPATQQCCDTGMCCGLNSECIAGQLACNL